MQSAPTPPALAPGYARAPATLAYTQSPGAQCAPGHYSDFLHTGILLSSIGIGSFPGAPTDEVDARIAEIVERGLCSGLNVVDTATHYRYGRSLRAVGEGLRRALAAGVPRDAMFLISKGGFLLFPDGPPRDPVAWFQREIAERGLGTRADLAAKVHLLSPAYIAHQIDVSREQLGVETLDAFLIDQPEVHIGEVGKPALIDKLGRVFVTLEQAVRDGKIRYYGISTFHSFRVVTDDKMFISLTSLLGLAGKAAAEVAGTEPAPHHLAIVQLPFNQVMLEGFTRFNQVTGQGNDASTLQAALQLKLFVMASHTLFKGHLGKQSVDVVQQALSTLSRPAQRAIQFNRSTPGLGCALVGMSTPAHLDDALAVAHISPMARQGFLGMFEKAG